MNPPGLGYFIAAAAWLVGWSEPALHAVFLVPAALAGLGTYRLAARLCSMPVLAVLATVLTPAFLVSGASVMSDMPLLALYVWAVFWWIVGIEEGRWRHLAFAAALIVLGMFVKYAAVTLVPLLAAYTLLQAPRRWKVLAWFLAPVAAIAAYHFLTLSLFGKSMVFGTVAFASEHTSEDRVLSFVHRSLVALAFSGGCLASVVCFAPLMWRGWRRWLVFALWPIALGALFALGRLDSRLIAPESGVRWGFALQASLMIAAGIHLAVLAMASIRREDFAHGALLCLWVLGIVVFAGSVNWTVNGRTLLACAPAAGILVARAIAAKSNPPLAPPLPKEGDSGSAGASPSPAWMAGISYRFALPVIASFVVAWSVASGDASLANSHRDAAHELDAKFRDPKPAVRFQGHWGFQWYMEAAGFRAYNDKEGLTPGSVLIVPRNSPSTLETAQPFLHPRLVLGVRNSPPVRTMSRETGAGFHSHFWGPLPFVLRFEETSEEFDVFDVRLK